MNKWLRCVLVLGVQILFLFGIWTYVEGNNKFDISGNKSAIYQITKNMIEDEYEKLRRDKITPWSFLHSGHSLKIKDYYGKEIYYSGVIKFEGSPEHKFWNDFIEPFLEDIVFRSIDNTIKLCRDKKLYSATPIRETGGLLKVLVRKVYNDMADVDRRLRGAGFPQNIEKKDVSGKINPFLSLIDERIKSELSIRKRLNEFYHYNDGLIWLIGIILACFAGHITYRSSRKNRFAQASIAFTENTLSALEGLYPIPANWPQDIDRHLRGIFPKLQSTVSVFREALPWYKRKRFDKAWFIYRLSETGREIDKQCYHHYMPFQTTTIINDKEITTDSTETYKEEFKCNVKRLLDFADQRK